MTKKFIQEAASLRKKASIVKGTEILKIPRFCTSAQHLYKFRKSTPRKNNTILDQLKKRFATFY